MEKVRKQVDEMEKTALTVEEEVTLWKRRLTALHVT